MVEVLTVIVVTLVAVVVMVNFKDYVNRSEAIRAMQQLGEIVLEYHEKNGKVPPGSFIDNIKSQLKGGARLGRLQYRGRWIYFDAEPDEILAYTKKNYASSLLSDGYIMLQLDGTVKWMRNEEFKELLARQQSEIEIEMTRK